MKAPDPANEHIASKRASPGASIQDIDEIRDILLHFGRRKTDIISNIMPLDEANRLFANALREAHQKLNEAYGKQFLEMVGEDGENTSRNALRAELRQAIKEKYLGKEEPKHVHDNFCLNYGKCSE